MWIPIVIIILCTMLTEQHLCIHLIDLKPEHFKSEETIQSNTEETDDTTISSELHINSVRRYWLVNEKPAASTKSYLKSGGSGNALGYEVEKDENLKNKISTLVQQTIHDTERQIKSIQYLKEKYRDQAPYRVGFILSMVKKSRDVLNELFNVAVKHRDDWKALEQMKLFEMIVHTNVDTTNLVRQLVEIHIQHLNATAGEQGGQTTPFPRKRVVLL